LQREMDKYFIGLILFTLIGFGCDKKPTGPDRVPLDGRGGGVIAYCYQPLTGNFNHQIYIMNADGSGNQKLIDADIGLNHHDWSPDARQLAAVGYVNQSTWSIYVFDAEGTNLTRLTTTTNVNDSEPHWSPDGTQIVFTRIYPNQNDRTEIWIMNANGSSQAYIGVEGFAAKWSPDGTRLIYQSSMGAGSDIYTCHTDGSDMQQLTDTVIDEWFPIWSPDMTQIAFNAYPTGDYDTSEIFIMNADGTNRRQLTDNTVSDGYPRFSPDGLLLAFTRSVSAQKWEVFVLNVDGTDVRRVTNSPLGITAINAVWRPEY